MSGSTLKYKDYLYVGVQLVLFVAYFFRVENFKMNLPEWLRYLGLVVLVVGAVLGLIALLQFNTKLSPFPTPVFRGKLITNGAFAIARHSIYTTLISSVLGYVLYMESLYKLLIVLILSTLFYFKSRYEERLLSQLFPEYKLYQK
ncbi:isoprenylcysteine carboxylmethyltransferase family protein [Mesonia sp. K7]|uniref:methyltransferase family protein n=1 Tax=Mesonia sp. K7 TaxID=2218606 RepID=UPI000DA764FB|nr:methyltransferase [Mesonia sp. K7]PZD77120.1 isoprenylcysteine carboxylmethyltransferase family protein [Mesonia sp. K7]